MPKEKLTVAQKRAAKRAEDHLVGQLKFNRENCDIFNAVGDNDHYLEDDIEDIVNGNLTSDW